MTGDRLAYIDQATFLSWRATGRAQLAQYVWVYPRMVDMDRLRRFHDDLGYGLAGRLIEPSTLPFGRHRWVAANGPAAPLDVAETRPPDQLGTWIDERSQRPIDPVLGPGWHLGVLTMTDGATAVSLVVSHCLLDGGGSLRTLVDAVSGDRRYFGYRQPHSRKPLAALFADLRQVGRDLPEIGRTVVAAAKFAYRSRHEIASSGGSRPAAGPGHGPDSDDVAVCLPAVSAIVDVKEWDARAHDLGGTSYSLLAGFAAVLGERLGRAHPTDGTVTLLIAMSDRAGPRDLRGNAMKIATATVDPGLAPTDLVPTRSVVRAALTALRDVPDEKHELLPITPFVPKRAVRRTADVVFGDLPVSCSNLGEAPAAIVRPDGTDAEYVLFRPADQNVTREAIERSGGQLVLAAGRVAGTMSIGVIGYQVGAANSREWLADQVVETLGQFGLKGAII